MKKKRYTRQSDNFLLIIGVVVLVLLWAALIALSPN